MKECFHGCSSLSDHDPKFVRGSGRKTAVYQRRDGSRIRNCRPFGQECQTEASTDMPAACPYCPYGTGATTTTLAPIRTENFSGVFALTSISQPSGVSNVASFPK